MPKGGIRRGAGRPAGSRNKSTLAREAAAAAAAAVDADDGAAVDPLSVGLRALRRLELAGDWKGAGVLAAKLAKFTTQALKPTNRAPPPHAAQRLPLFDDVSPSRPVVPDDNPAAALARRLLKVN